MLNNSKYLLHFTTSLSWICIYVMYKEYLTGSYLVCMIGGSSSKVAVFPPEQSLAVSFPQTNSGWVAGELRRKVSTVASLLCISNRL